MSARAERHAWIEFYHDLAVGRLIFLPWRTDDDLTADANRPVMLLPRVGPILFLTGLDFELANRAHPAEMPEGRGNLLNVGVRNIDRGNKRAHGHRPERST